MPERWGPDGRGRKNNECIVWRLLGYLYGKLMEIIGLKAPGNYCASIWSNKFSISLLEKQEPDMFMISAFLGLVGTGIYGFNIPKYT